MCLEIRKRPFYSLFDGQLWLPSKFAYFGCIQKDKRVIADPSAISARKDKFRVDGKAGGDPAYAIGDLTVLIGAKVEYVDWRRGFFQGAENGIYAIMHIKIRLSLPAISQYFKLFWIGSQLLEEVDHVPMCVSLTKNANKSKYGSLETITFAICLNQALSG
jgi:hypothetical protein